MVTRTTRDTPVRPARSIDERPSAAATTQPGDGEREDEGVEAKILRLDSATLERLFRLAGQ